MPTARETSEAIRHGFPGQRMFVLPPATVASALRGGRGLGLLPTDVGYFPHAVRHRVGRPRGVGELIVITCVAGAGWAEVAGRRIDVTAGQTLVLRAGLPHAYGAADRDAWSVHWAHLAGPAALAAEPLLVDESADPVIEVGRDAALARRFERVFDVVCDSQSREALLHASLLAAGILERLIDARRQAATGDDLPGRMSRAVHLMWQRASGRVTLDELADAAGMSASHFAASFRRHAGAPPLEYFGRLQMRQAAHLLEDTDLPVKAVAARLGYDDPLYFSRRFRKFHHASPAQYRDGRRGENGTR